MRTETVNIYKFAELSDAAKEKARDWFKGAGQYDQWWSEVYNNAKTIGALVGFEIDDIGFSGFWSQGDGAHFVGSLGYVKGAVKSVKALYPGDETLIKIIEQWQAIQKQNGYKVTGTVKHSGHYQHSGCTSFDIEKNGNYPDDDLEASVKACARSFMD